MNWKKFLEEETAKDYFLIIKKVIAEDRDNGIAVFPSDAEMFRVFEAGDGVPVDVVILGQDPYPKAGDAHGIAFSVERNDKLPASLKNIFKELDSDLFVKNISGNLTNWVKEGIFLLNTRLSVQEGKPMSHGNIGYDVFVDAVLTKIASENPDVIFLLFGKEAEKYARYCKEENCFKVCHPSPLAAYRGFFGSKVFSRVNQRLEKLGKKPKSWRT